VVARVRCDADRLDGATTCTRWVACAGRGGPPRAQMHAAPRVHKHALGSSACSLSVGHEGQSDGYHSITAITTHVTGFTRHKLHSAHLGLHPGLPLHAAAACWIATPHCSHHVLDGGHVLPNVAIVALWRLPDRSAWRALSAGS
jgi:hypothetical protein